MRYSLNISSSSSYELFISFSILKLKKIVDLAVWRRNFVCAMFACWPCIPVTYALQFRKALRETSYFNCKYSFISFLLYAYTALNLH